MWTPRRVLLAVTGFAALAAAYFAYSLVLGGIDGLPPLPEEYLPADKFAGPQPSAIRPRNSADQKLEQAFGLGWEESLKCSLRLDVKAKNLVLATKDFTIEPDGKVRLEPFNIALFAKEKGDAKFPEINTVQSRVAYLTFDHPVSSFADMGRHKIVACELRDDICIRNNRRTPQREDDVSVTTPGPMFYREDQHLISTAASVQLLDEQSKPEPTKITAEGLELHLTTDSEVKPAAAAGPRKERAQSIGGVERIDLLANVEMHLWPDGNSGFLGGPRAAGNDPKEKPPEKAQVVITTHGPFRYAVSPDNAATPDRAFFHIPERRGALRERVTVTRLAGPAGQEKRDQLFCDHLELTFRRKADADTEKGAGATEQLAIQEAHATSDSGSSVELQSEAEELAAYGNDFFYDARTKESLLKGTPEMFALKEAHEIHARELRMQSAGQKEVQKARAKGPGRIAMLNRESGKRTLFARWADEMEFDKDGGLDSLTFKGQAAFEDKEHGQDLRADRLRLWLKPADHASPAAGEAQRMKPHRLEATGHVRADSPELHVKEPTEYLVIRFKDAPTGPAPTPAGTAPAAPAAAELPRSNSEPAATPPVAAKSGGPDKPAVPTTPGAQGKGTAAADTKKPPMELSATTVHAYVNRVGDKNELDRVWCQGAVHVHQEPSSPDDRGVDITGDTLNLDHSPDGSILLVKGSLAEVQMNKICILGPNVSIDQKDNRVKVFGIGAMIMITDKNLDGGKLEKPTELKIHWNKDMDFDGTNALFRGGVQAERLNERLRCQEMQVFLDRKVSFKEGEKGDQPAKVRNLVCDRECRIEETTLAADGQLQRYTRLTSPAVDMDNEEGKVNAAGPGVVHIHQLEDEDGGPEQGDVLPKPPVQKPDPNRKQARKELVLTRVSYLSRMYANNRDRTAFFYGDVDVVHVPTPNVDVVVNLDRPPPGCMHLHSEQLKVFTRVQANGQKAQEMEAEKRVVVEAQEFVGRGEMVKYNEALARVILEGGPGGVATLYQRKNQAGRPQTFTGKTIIYYRNTGEVKVMEGQGIHLN